jgi:hypothetical protein
MNGYLWKVLTIFGLVFLPVNGGWIISSFYMMSNSPEQKQIFAIQGFLIWLACLIIGLIFTYILASPVQEGLEKLETGTLDDRELISIITRNRRLPYYLSLLTVIMITVYDIIIYAFYLMYDIGPFASNGLWATNIGANMGLPVVLYGAFSILMYPFFNLMNLECKTRDIPFDEHGLKVSTKMISLFILMSLGVTLWIGMIGFYEGFYRIKEEAESNLLATQKYVINEIKATKGNNNITVDDLKPIIDRLIASNMGKALVSNNQGAILYNPSGMHLFTQTWKSIDKSIIEAMKSGRPQKLYENVHERLLCFTPVGGDLVIGLSTDRRKVRPLQSFLYCSRNFLSHRF